MSGIEITATGNVATDPELRYTNQGIPVLSFLLIVNHREKDGNGNWVDGQPSRVQVTAWRHLAENTHATIRKGVEVVVRGSGRVREYTTKNGVQTRDLEVTAEELGASLRWVTATLQKATPATSAPSVNNPQNGAQGGQYQPRGGFTTPQGNAPQTANQAVNDAWNQAQPQSNPAPNGEPPF